MKSFNHIFSTRKFNRHYRFLIFCFFWFFLIVPLSRTTETMADIVTKGNYVLTVLLPIWTYNAIFRKRIRYFNVKLRILLKRVLTPVLLYLLVMGLQIFLNPHTSDILTFRRLSVAVVPSISLALLAAFYTLGSPKSQLLLIRALFIILFLMALLSALGIGTDVAEHTRQITDQERDKGIVQQSNNYGYFLALLFILSVAGYLRNINILGNRYIYILVMLFTFILILRTGSYGAIILSLLCSLPLLFKTSSPRKLFGVIISLPIFILVLWSGIKFESSKALNPKETAFISALSKKSTKSVYEASTFLLRYEILVDGIKRLMNNPITGYGYSNRGGYSISRREKIPVHNAFIVSSLQGGVFIGILMLIFYWWMINYTLKIKKRKIKVLAFSLLSFMFLSDNTLTGFSFLSLTSGVIAFSILMIILTNSLFFKSRSVMQTRPI